MKLAYLWIAILLSGISFQTIAQDDLSPERKQAVDSLALEKGLKNKPQIRVRYGINQANGGRKTTIDNFYQRINDLNI